MPRNYCAVDGCCSNKRFKQVSFFCLPKEKELRKKWLKLIGRSDLAEYNTNPRSHFVCSLHFEESMMVSVPKLKPDATPTRLLPAAGAGAGRADRATQTDDLKFDISSALISSSDSPALGDAATTRKRKPRADSEETDQKRKKQPNGFIEIKEEVIF